MLSSDIPTKFAIAFASGAGPGFITTPIPTPPQAGGRASLQQGFSELNFDPLASGGIPPFGKDFNGLMNMVTNWLRWAAAGGIPVGYDAAFAATISGYPAGAFLKAATGNRFWISTAENNVTNPDAGGAGWIPFPDVIVQRQAGNYAIDTGTPNNYAVTLDPATFISINDLVGSPIRVKVGGTSGANTVTNPTLRINSLTPLTMINSSGAPLLIGQIARSGQIFEGYPDGDGFFQVTSPAPIVGVPGFQLPPGTITLWPNEVPPSWALECAGQLLPVASYPNLFNAILFQYGGNMVDQFRLPDYRGVFVRGWDHGRGADPNAATRTNRGDGTTGDHNGTNQSGQVGSFVGSILNPLVNWAAGFYNQQFGNGGFSAGSRKIALDGWLLTGVGFNTALDATHTANVITPGAPPGEPVPANFFRQNSDYTDSGYAQGYSVAASSISGTFTGGSETRPININSMFIIAY